MGTCVAKSEPGKKKNMVKTRFVFRDDEQNQSVCWRILEPTLNLHACLPVRMSVTIKQEPPDYTDSPDFEETVINKNKVGLCSTM